MSIIVQRGAGDKPGQDITTFLTSTDSWLEIGRQAINASAPLSVKTYTLTEPRVVDFVAPGFLMGIVIDGTTHVGMLTNFQIDLQTDADGNISVSTTLTVEVPQ